MKLTYYYVTALLSSLLFIGALTGCASTGKEVSGGQDPNVVSSVTTAPAAPTTPTAPTTSTTPSKSATASFSPEVYTHGVNSSISSAEVQESLPKTVKFKRFAPFFAHPYTSGTMGAMDVFFYGETGTDFEVIKGNEEWICVNTTYGPSWVPKWYSSKEAGEIITQKPAEITPSSNAELVLHPGSSVNWEREQWQDNLPDGKLISVLRWQDWRGVVILPQEAYKDYRVVHPALLWIRDSEVTDKKQLKGKLSESVLSADMTRAIVDIVLSVGATPSEIVSLIGEPTFKEDSISLNSFGGLLRVGEDWRYEGMEPELIVTFSETQRLERLTWKPPLVSHEELRVMGDQHPLSRYIFQPMSSVSSKLLNWTWRNQGELPFTYLRYATPFTLLIYGDDGGFSGMHNDSNLYAINRKNGRKLWQIDAGYGSINTTLDQDGQFVTILTSFSKAKQEYDYHLRRIRMTDGKIMWQNYLPHNTEDGGYKWMVGAGNRVILYGDSIGGKDIALSGLNARTGKVMWSLMLDGSSRIMNKGEEPFVLIKLREKLLALDPDNGMVIWTVEGTKAATSSEIYEDFYSDTVFQQQSPFGKSNEEGWVLLGQERLLIELKTGQVKSRYSPLPGGRDSVKGWSGSLLLIQRETSIIQSERESYETILLDTSTGKELWKKKGGATGAVFEGDILYVFLNGPATALNVRTGEILWQLPLSEAAKTEGYARAVGQVIYPLKHNQLIISVGQDLLLLRKSDGAILNRIGDSIVDYPEARDSETRNGLINSEGNDLYIGSANGKFSRVQLPLQ